MTAPNFALYDGILLTVFDSKGIWKAQV